MERLIDAIIKLVNQIHADENSDMITTYADEVVEAYVLLYQSSNNIFDDFDRVFADAPDMYLLTMSVLFELFKKREFLDKAEEILLSDGLGWDATTAVQLQIESLRFQNENMDESYEDGRRFSTFMTNKLLSLLDMELCRQPYANRNHRRILVTADTLLSVQHAPTQSLLELCKMLQADLGYEVLLGIHVPKTSAVVNEMWLFPNEKNYNAQADGVFCVEYEGCELKGYQQIVDEEHIESIKQYIEFVREWNPEFIWHIGSTSPLTEILGKAVTLVASSCVAECAISDAQVVFNATEKAGKYLRDKHQKELEFWIKIPIREAQKTSNVSQYGFSEDNFIIAIVGNRLDNEINKEFIDFMHELAGANPSIRYVTIGRCSIDWEQHDMRDKVCNYGYSRDLAADLSIVDLYLNPKRTGGGISALYSLSAGTPVLTFPDCDVARNCGGIFTCHDYEEMREAAERYLKDEDYYCRQRQAAFARADDARLKDNVGACKNIVRQITDWLQQGELD